jgi:hypothetical protein
MTSFGAACVPQVPPERIPEVAAGRAGPPRVVGYVHPVPGESAEQVAARVRDLAEGGADTVLLAPRDREREPAAFMDLAAQAFLATTP